RIRPCPKDAAVMLDRGLGLAALAKQVGEIVMRLGVIGLDRESAFELRARLDRMPRGRERETVRVVLRPPRGIERERLRAFAERLAREMKMRGRLAEIAVGRRIVRMQPERFAQML